MEHHVDSIHSVRWAGGLDSVPLHPLRMGSTEAGGLRGLVAVTETGRRVVLDVERWAELRWECFVRGVSIKELERRTGLARPLFLVARTH